MSTLTMPSVVVAFAQQASTAIARSQKGTVALLLRDAALAGSSYSLSSPKQIPTALGSANRTAVERAFLGYVKPPQKVLLYVMDEGDAIASGCEALAYLATAQFDYLAGPADITAAEATAIKTWILAQRAENHAIFKAVLPDMAGDSEAIINFTTKDIDLGTTEKLSAAAYCGRIAGLLAGTPMRISGSFAPLQEVADVERLTQVAMDAAVGQGKLLAFYDGEKVKLGRAVNSLVTTAGKGDAWKKIKIVELLDMVQRDIRKIAQDSWVGKYPNSYASKLLLVTAITGYLQQLARDELIEADFSCGIDVDAQEAWLQSQGKDTAEMTEQEIKEANTGTQAFFVLHMRPIDAVEDISIVIYL